MLARPDSRPAVHGGLFRSAVRGGIRSGLPLLATLAVLVIGGCGDDRSAEPADDLPPLDVVSLSPAITTTMIDLGQADRLVGRTPWCRGIDDRPVVGTLEGVDAEVLVALRPAVVLHQPPATGTDPVLLELQERLGFTLGGGRLDGVRDVLDLLEQVEGMELAASEKIESRRRALVAIEGSRVPEDAPVAALLYSIDSIGIAGEDTYFGELSRAVGLRNAAGPGGWREWSLEMLVSAGVDVVVVFTQPGMESTVRERFNAIQWPRRPALVVVTSPDAFEPSTRMPRVLEEFQRRVEEAGVLGRVVPSSRDEGEVIGEG